MAASLEKRIVGRVRAGLGDWVSLGEVLSALDLLDLNHAVSSALARLYRRGWLEAVERNGRMFFALGEAMA